MIDTEEQIVLDGFTLSANVRIPKAPLGLVLFAHGSGSSRLSPRNRFVADVLYQHHIASLLVDLLTVEEEKIDEITRELRFNINLLAERLVKITHWIFQKPNIKSLPLAYFGASTGAAAALIAAAKIGPSITSVVSRGGRPDLASSFLSQVNSPSLLIIGELDTEVIELNQEAYALLHCQKQIKIIPGATHLFEEPGCLEQVAEVASKWFKTHFQKTHP